MSVATSSVEVGVRDLKNNLSRYLARVRAGEHVIVTDRGKPIARLGPVDPATDHLVALVSAGLVRPPQHRRRRRSAKRIQASASVSELVADQRR